MLEKVRTVLIHNSHPGNIGAAARALKNMGLTQLTLVSPKEFPSSEAEARAAHAVDILNNASVFPTLKEALGDCNLILGCSGRPRTFSLPMVTPREAALEIQQHLQYESTQENNDDNHGSQVAILFGNEQSGLSNEDLETCHFQIQIPTNPNYPSLNLAAAVQIIAYELFLIADSLAHSTMNSPVDSSVTPSAIFSKNYVNQPTPSPLPNYETLDEFYQALEQTLIDLQFLDPRQPGYLMVRLKRLFARAKIDKVEVTILRGMIAAIQKLLHK